ncbi:hypothetical protein HNP10_003441 [Aeromonas veronii]|nr:hypothetical protein [Aeromonas veronii]
MWSAGGCTRLMAGLGYQHSQHRLGDIDQLAKLCRGQIL